MGHPTCWTPVGQLSVQQRLLSIRALQTLIQSILAWQPSFSSYLPPNPSEVLSSCLVGTDFPGVEFLSLLAPCRNT